VKKYLARQEIFENFFALFRNISIFSNQLFHKTPTISKETSTLPKREEND
jgi:hypothetical protein